MPPDSMSRSIKTVKNPVYQPASIKAGSSRSRSAARLTLPDLPREQWCDFRISYVEGNRTLVQLAEEYMCDPRTVKSCILRNKSSSSLGKKSVPTQIDLCKDEIRETLRKTLPDLPESIHSIYQLSNYLLPILREQGYKGSERTLRNYLHMHPSIKALFEKDHKAHSLPERIQHD